MKQNLTSLYLFICLVVISMSSTVHADTVLLLHGYLGSSYEWQQSGVVDRLDANGWRNAGVLSIYQGRVRVNKRKISSIRRSYSVELESEQSIDTQAEQLNQYIEYIRHKHSEEQIILVGHSAGGVIARLYMVKNPSEDLSALITIASPHLGTKNAEFAQTVSENILVWIEGFPGVGKLYRSQGLFFDLMPNRSDNLIGWLNFQEHPQARYYSIVREETDDTLQDFVVPSWSQDMNEVYALRGRSTLHTVKSMHGLTGKDADILTTILIDLYTI